MPLRRTALLLLITLSNTLCAAETVPGCLKRVFDDYCLGGNLQQSMQRHPGGVPAQRQGDHGAVIYPQGHGRIYVMAYQGRIYKILQTYEPATQVQFKELLERLEEKYGPHRDLSHYPGYARNRAAQIGAIRRGEGALKYLWQVADQPWRIELEWTRRLGISLAYLANDLDKTQSAALDQGL